MAVHLLNELKILEDQLLALSGTVENSLHAAIKALHEHDNARARQIIANDITVDREEVRLEEECLKVLALYQPVAGDLRRIIAILKINNELERIGDMAVVISQCALELDQYIKFEIPPQLGTMAAVAQSMITDSLNAFVRADAKLARRVIDNEALIKTSKRELRALIAKKIEDGSPMPQGFLPLIEAAHALERVGARAANISENIVYMLDGEIVRHQHGV
jgi:phosphate transport system protein